MELLAAGRNDLHKTGMILKSSALTSTLTQVVTSRQVPEGSLLSQGHSVGVMKIRSVEKLGEISASGEPGTCSRGGRPRSEKKKRKKKKKKKKKKKATTAL
jgi:hypothetical protein